MVGTTTVVQGARVCELAIFGALTLGALVQWRRRPSPAAAWLTALLGIIAAGIALARATDADPLGHPSDLDGRLVIALILLIPYALFRFTASFERAPGPGVTRRKWLAGAATAV